MKTSELEKFIQGQSLELYSMAYILIPDDLQASQLMIDAVTSFLIQKKILIEKWLGENSGDSEKKQKCRTELLKTMYEISRKRYHQLKMSLKEVEDTSGFFALDFDEKTALFLKEQARFELDSIEFIMAKSRNEILAHLYSARLKMVEGMNTVIITGQVMQQQGN